MPIYRKLHKLVFGGKELTDDEVNDLVFWTKEIYGRLRIELSLVAFWDNAGAVARLRGEISNYIADVCTGATLGFPNRKTIASEIVAWAADDRNHAAILAARD
jgi:hypothetical protein